MNNLSCYAIPPIILHLFNSTTTTIITEATNLPVLFPSHNFTLLDSDCRIVLGHNWLTQYNPMIDWVLGSIKFRIPLQQVPAPSSLPNSDAQPLSALRLNPSSVSSPSPTNSPKAPSLQALPISLINAAAYIHACKLEGSIQFSIQLRPDGALRVASADAVPNLSAVPEEYCDFADVFSKTKASILAPHWEYDLKIELEEGADLPPSRLYSLSPLSSLRLFKHSSTKIFTSASSNRPHPPMQPLSSLSRRRIALSDCASTTKDSIRYPRRTSILYPSSPTSLTSQVR